MGLPTSAPQLCRCSRSGSREVHLPLPFFPIRPTPIFWPTHPGLVFSFTTRSSPYVTLPFFAYTSRTRQFSQPGHRCFRGREVRPSGRRDRSAVRRSRCASRRNTRSTCSSSATRATCCYAPLCRLRRCSRRCERRCRCSMCFRSSTRRDRREVRSSCSWSLVLLLELRCCI